MRPLLCLLAIIAVLYCQFDGVTAADFSGELIGDLLIKISCAVLAVYLAQPTLRLLAYIDNKIRG